MRAFLIVEVQPRSNPRLRLGNRSIGVQVYLFVFQSPPEPLHDDIIHAPALAADLDLAPLQHANKVIAGELAALIGVEDLGPSEPSQRLLQRLDTEVGVQGVGQAPGQNRTASMITTKYRKPRGVGV